MIINLWGTNTGHEFHVGYDMGHDYSRYLLVHISTNRSFPCPIFVNVFHINEARMIDA
jgi:hypothetical protein